MVGVKLAKMDINAKVEEKNETTHQQKQWNIERADLFDLPAAPNILDFNVMDLEEDFLGVLMVLVF